MRSWFLSLPPLLAAFGAIAAVNQPADRSIALTYPVIVAARLPAASPVACYLNYARA
jgi:hypothetical protein